MVRIGKLIWNRFSHLLLRPKRLAIFEACLIGLVSGLGALFLAQGVGWLGGWRQQATHLIPAYLALPLIGALGGFFFWLNRRSHRPRCQWQWHERGKSSAGKSADALKSPNCPSQVS